MNKIHIFFAFLTVVSAAIVMPVQADILLEFSDGTKCVWRDVFPDGESICTHIDGGTYCALRADVVKKYEVPAGTAATDKGINFGEHKIDQSASDMRRQAIDEMNAHARQRDREFTARQKRFEREQRKKRIDGKSEWSQ